MNKIILKKTQELLKIVKKVLPYISNKHLSKELKFIALQLIEEIKNLKEKEEKK